MYFFFFFQAEDGIRDHCVTGVQTCALPIFVVNWRTMRSELRFNVELSCFFLRLYINIEVEL